MTYRNMSVLYKHYLYKDFLELDMKKGTTKLSKLNLEDILEIANKNSIKIVFLPLDIWSSYGT